MKVNRAKNIKIQDQPINLQSKNSNGSLSESQIMLRKRWVSRERKRREKERKKLNVRQQWNEETTILTSNCIFCLPPPLSLSKKNNKIIIMRKN